MLSGVQLEDLSWLTEAIIALDSTPQEEQPSRELSGVQIETSVPESSPQQTNNVDIWVGENKYNPAVLLLSHPEITVEVMLESKGAVDGLARELASGTDHLRNPHQGPSQ